MSRHHNFTVTQPTQIHFGVDTIQQLPTLIRDYGCQHPLVVMDPGLEKAGLTQNILKPLESEKLTYTLYPHVEPEPGLKLADQGTDLARQQGCDCVVGVGGGSAMDIAKAIAVLLTNEGKAVEYLGLGKIKKPGVPKFMIPTSAGTGAEVTFTAVFINEKTGSKGGINGDELYPEAAILDPNLTVSLPPSVTAATGIDAFTHALEAYTSIQAHPLSESCSLQAIQLIGDNLRTAYADGSNIEARSNMLLASLLGGKSLAMAGVGLVHAMAYPMGGLFSISHGLANAVLLPYVTAYNLIGNLEKFAHVATLLGEVPTNRSTRETAERLVSHLTTLNQDLGIPATLSELNIPAVRIPQMADIALTVARPIENNPRCPSREDIIAIYERAMIGDNK